MAELIRPVHQPLNNLSADVEIKGLIKFQTHLSMDGKLDGEIISPGVLVLGENADVQGEIRTKSVTLHGKVLGNITVEDRCELRGCAELIGDLKASRLVIEGDATLIGKSEVTPNKVAMKVQQQPEVVRVPDSLKQVVGH